jgi:hypothetical protein
MTTGSDTRRQDSVASPYRARIASTVSLVHPQPLPDGALEGMPAQRRSDARTRASAGRYRAATVHEPRPPRPRHAQQAPSPQLFTLDPVRAVGGAVLVTAALAAFDFALTRRLSLFFDLCFILVSLSAAMSVQRRGLFAVGVLPPLLMGAVVAAFAVLVPSALTASHLAFVSTWLTGLAHHGGALAAAHVVVLALVGLRTGQQAPSGPEPQA